MRIVVLRAAWACAAACLLSGGISHAAEQPSPRPRLTLASALDAALERNPDLLASRYELTAAQARLLQAGLRPNPELSVELENFAGSGATRGVDALETTLSLSQVIELGGKRSLRAGAAQTDIDLLAIEQRARQLDALAEVTQRFIDVVVAQETMRFAIENSRLAGQMLETIAARVAAARSPLAEASRARIAATRAILDERQAEAQLRGMRYALAALWGDAEPAFEEASADLFSLPQVEPFGLLAQRIVSNPDIARFASEARLHEAELRLAQAQARPNLTLSVGVRRLGESADAALVAGFSMPLPVHDRNQGAIREARARAYQSLAQQDAAVVRARATLYAIYQQMDAARARVGALRDEAIPQAQMALEQMQAGYERGRFSFVELLSTRQELVELRAAAIAAAADFHRLLAEIERITSEPLTTDDIEAPLP